MATIEHLPPEILELIFTFMHEERKLETKHFDLGLSEFQDSDDEEADATYNLNRLVAAHSIELLSSKMTSLFPYSCARVSGRWKNILSSSPAFWTRVILFVDSPQATAEEIGMYFAWSRDLPIDVFITHSSIPALPFNKAFERRNVEAYVNFLQPHMTRCRSLHIDVVMNSSIPHISRCVPNNAPLLTYLTLKADFEDADAAIWDFSIQETSVSSELHPNLKMMSIDGRSFHQAFFTYPEWLEQQDQLRHLSISNLKEDDPRLSLSSTIDSIDAQLNYRLASLRLNRLTFDVDTDDLLPDHALFTHLQELYFQDIPGAVISEMFRICDFPVLHLLHIQNCTGLKKRTFDIPFPIPCLAISQFLPDGADFEYLSYWGGRGLIATTSSLDSLIDALAAQREPDTDCDIQRDIQGGRCFLAPCLHVLLFVSCPVPSFASLKKLVEERNHYIDYDDPGWKTNYSQFGPALYKVEFKQCWTTSDSLSLHEDRAWLAEKLPEFVWDTSTVITTS